MEVELYTEEASDDENYVHDDNIEDYLDFEGERCGICMEVIIDRGVLDCCQHWFCFACIDNWATITSLCPLCQNEFQLITCVPVYDTVGGNKTDEEADPRDDEWFVEGNNNTLSFPSYYIDENAVACLDGDGCKIRSGSVVVEEDSDIDTSIACDSCDKWYHAFCVGFDPNGTCDSSWLCPRCTIDKAQQKSERLSMLRQSYQHGLEVAGAGSQLGDSFSGRVSVSVAGVGETAIIVSLVEANKRSHESGDSVSGFSIDLKDTSCNSTPNIPESEAPLNTGTIIEPSSAEQKVEVSLSQDNTFSSYSLSTVEDADQKVMAHLIQKSLEVDTDIGLSAGSYKSVGVKDNEKAKDEKAEFMEPILSSEECSLSDDKISNNMISDEAETSIRKTSAKRKHRDSRNANDGEIEAKFSQKKIKAERNRELNCRKEKTLESTLDDSRTDSSRNISKEMKCTESGAIDITSIIQGSDRKSVKHLGHKVSSGATSEEKETAGGLRLKKIMRRTGNDKDSSTLVQELRKKIKEAVRNKSSKELGRSNFDPKLLDAFRAALSGSGTENRKPNLDVKAKKAMLQKGKVRESLTKKIYGAGGKRKRAWTRECEVEFWKHRCLQASKPEKVQTLKSVLDLLRDDTDNNNNTKKVIDSEEEQRGSILSRLYLADTSLRPRKNDVKPVACVNAMATSEQNTETVLTDKNSKSSLVDKFDRIPPKISNLPQVVVPPLDSKGMKSLNGMKVSSNKEVVGKSDVDKGDKRKWALELLARKTSASSKSGQEKEEDGTILKGNYPLLAQLPKDMRPVLAPSRHNKIPASVRQAQLYRLTEHFLKKANLSGVCKTAETELAVADAVNIEKEVADRSNSKLVYVNLCSQELLRRSDNTDFDNAKESKESNPSSTSEDVFVRASEEAESSTSDLTVDVDEALRNAGLMSPPDSPNHVIEDDNSEDGSLENVEKEGPDNIPEVDSNADLDIYGDFEYNLEDEDFIGAAALRISEPQPEEPKIKLVFSSVNPDKPEDAKEVNGSSGLPESHSETGNGSLTVDSETKECPDQNSVIDWDEEPSLAECEELYGPDKEPLVVKYPETVSMTSVDQMVTPVEKGDLKESPSELQKTKKMKEKEKNKAENSSKQLEISNTIAKKVEAYIKEHLRPLCKSGVITVEQYRWAVARTTEKVMKYHSKEKNANFLIKEGEKVKRLAEQYVEAAPQKAKD